MNPSPSSEEFTRRLKDLYGRRWREAGARQLRLDPVTIWRYANGRTPIPFPVMLAVRSLKGLTGRRRTV